MARPSREITCQDAQRLALRILLPRHLAGCVVVLGLCYVFIGFELTVFCRSFLLLTAPLPKLASDLLGTVAYGLFHRTTLPIAAFIRSDAVLLVLTLAIWLLIFLGCFPGMP